MLRNHQGFAITTILYGMLMMATLIIFLLLSTLSFTNDSSSDLIHQIEKELNESVGIY